jgi:hypothetical protein
MKQSAARARKREPSVRARAFNPASARWSFAIGALGQCSCAVATTTRCASQVLVLTGRTAPLDRDVPRVAAGPTRSVEGMPVSTWRRTSRGTIELRAEQSKLSEAHAAPGEPAVGRPATQRDGDVHHRPTRVRIAIGRLPAAVGMRQAVEDEAARVFGGQPYNALGFGHSLGAGKASGAANCRRAGAVRR